MTAVARGAVSLLRGRGDDDEVSSCAAPVLLACSVRHLASRGFVRSDVRMTVYFPTAINSAPHD